MNACGKAVPNSRCSDPSPAFLAVRFGLTSRPFASEYSKTTSSPASIKSCFRFSPRGSSISPSRLGKLDGLITSGNLRYGIMKDSAKSSSSGDRGPWNCVENY